MSQTSFNKPIVAKKVERLAPNCDSLDSDLNRSSSIISSQLQSHIDRAKIISLYGEAFKKFDWLLYLLASFLLFILSLLAFHFLGALATSICTVMGTAALVLLKKKSG